MFVYKESSSMSVKYNCSNSSCSFFKMETNIIGKLFVLEVANFLSQQAKVALGTALAVQWLTSPSNAGGVGSIPGRGAKLPHTSQPKN